MDSGMVISGKRSEPVFLSLLASRCVRAHKRTSTPFLARITESVIPQLVVPIIAIFCIFFIGWVKLWLAYLGSRDVVTVTLFSTLGFSPIRRSVPLNSRRMLSRCIT